MDNNNEVVNNVVENPVINAGVVETVAEHIQQAIQPVQEQLPAVVENVQKTFLGLNQRQWKDAGVITGIGAGSILIFETGKALVRKIPGWIETGKNRLKTAKGVKLETEKPAAEAPQTAPAENPVPAATTEVPATPQK